jgi:hypothetical protein
MKTCGSVAMILLLGVGILFASCTAFLAKVNRDVQEKKQAEEAKLTPEEREERDRNEKLKNDNWRKGIQLQVEVKKYILSKLKAPSTAKIDLESKESADHKTIFVIGTVDSQNSFGAMLRSNVKASFDAQTLKQIEFDWQQP